MKLYSSVEEPISSSEDEIKDDQAPYNWILILFILVGYIFLTLIS